jgi:prolyl-tRNA editing enzyme YbaK/EbsC (Cys-tRNA(Pro) deacylase)
MHPTTARVAAALAEAGLDTEIREFAETTRTAQEAADTLGVAVGAIVKSLCFVADDTPVILLVSGANRADLEKLRSLLGATNVVRANAQTVRAATGFAIGGVPPVAHATSSRLIIDRDLLQYGELWAAAGTPNSVFRITPGQLVEVTGGDVRDIVETPQ